VSVLTPVTFSHRHPVWAVLAGVGATTGGHVLSALVFIVTLRTIAPDGDIGPGGGLWYGFLSLIAFAVAETVLFTAALSVGVGIMHRNPKLGVGILTGWAGGVLVYLGLALMYWIST
jgi:hypothetical protein